MFTWNKDFIVTSLRVLMYTIIVNRRLINYCSAYLSSVVDRMLLIFGTECTVCIAMMPVVLFTRRSKTKCCDFVNRDILEPIHRIFVLYGRNWCNHSLH